MKRFAVITLCVCAMQFSNAAFLRQFGSVIRRVTQTSPIRAQAKKECLKLACDTHPDIIAQSQCQYEQYIDKYRNGFSTEQELKRFLRAMGIFEAHHIEAFCSINKQIKQSRDQKMPIDIESITEKTVQHIRKRSTNTFRLIGYNRIPGHTGAEYKVTEMYYAENTIKELVMFVLKDI